MASVVAIERFSLPSCSCFRKDVIRCKHRTANSARKATIIASASGNASHYPKQTDAPVAQRRCVLLTLAALPFAFAERASAVQGTIAGRLPGLTSEPDEDGFLVYKRPEGKSGGHGVGWSEIPRYSFKVPPGWQEVPVSIADLGGTEIDLRFVNRDEGNLQVVVAPVLRFADIGFNAKVSVDDLGGPDRLIDGFAPELFGKPLNEGDVLDTKEVQKGGVKYYEWELTQHRLVSATAVGNRVFLLAVEANGRQWRRAGDALLTIQRSFTVPSV